MRSRQARSKKVSSVRVSPLQKVPYEVRAAAERDSLTARPDRAAAAAAADKAADAAMGRADAGPVDPQERDQADRWTRGLE